VQRVLVGAATALASLVALVFACTAAAVPRILVYQSDYRPSVSAVADIGIAFEKKDPAPGRIAITLQGGTLDVAAPAGTDIGFAAAQVQTGAESPFSGRSVGLKGSLRVLNPADHLVDGAACTGQSLHDAVWDLSLAREGLGLDLTLYVDRKQPGQQGKWLITMCPKSPYVPEDQGGAPYGTDIQQLFFRIARIYRNGDVPSLYRWSALFMPYMPGTSTLNPHGTVEARALMPIPYRLLLWRGRTTVASMRIAGTLTASHLALAGARLDVYAGPRPDRLKFVGRTTRLTKRGAYSFTRKNTGKTMYFQVVFGPFDVTRMGPTFCGGPSEAPLGCVSATLSEIDSSVLRVPAKG
jgi:hypothetical protein